MASSKHHSANHQEAKRHEDQVSGVRETAKFSPLPYPSLTVTETGPIYRTVAAEARAPLPAKDGTTSAKSIRTGAP